MGTTSWYYSLAVDCKEKAGLVEKHHEAALEYSRAAMELNRKRGSSTMAEYSQLRAAVDGARVKSTEARVAVERHRAKHGC